jgi:hypothetical protein
MVAKFKALSRRWKITIIVGVLALGIIGTAVSPDEPVSAKPHVVDVRGLSLPIAKQTLKRAGYATSVTSDSLMGVVIEENYIVCDQHDPKGHLVPIEVSKHGC